MPLDPLAKAYLDQLAATQPPRLWDIPITRVREDFRVMARTFGPKDVPVGKVGNLTLSGPSGDIPLRLYTPVAAGGEALPALVYFHGGAFVMGDLETHDAACRILAAESGCRVVAVDYRLAPEHKFPAAVEDAFAATRWIEVNAARLGIDANRLAVGGDSAGGNLAAVVCRMAKEQDGPKLAYQLLLFPVTQFGETYESARLYASGYSLEKKSLDWCYGQYVPPGADLKDARLSPLLAGDCSGLPPAYVMLAECDMLHDEGLAYADKLRAADVPVTVADYPGLIHGFTMLQSVLPQAHEALTKAATALREVFVES
jgi:acetyl esterase